MAEFELEKKAKQNWCPKVQVAVYLDGKGVLWAVTSRGETCAIEELPKLTRCIASGCGAWVDGPEVENATGTQAEKMDSLSGRMRLVNTGKCGFKR